MEIIVHYSFTKCRFQYHRQKLKLFVPDNTLLYIGFERQALLQKKMHSYYSETVIDEQSMQNLHSELTVLKLHESVRNRSQISNRACVIH